MRAVRPRPAAWLLLLGTLAACNREAPDTARLPPEIRVTVSGHHEGRRVAGELVPLFLGTQTKIQLCLTVPAAEDTSGWEGRLGFPGEPFAPPSARLGRTLCFRHPLPAAGSATARLCGEVRDRFDGRRFRLPCQPVAFQTDLRTYRAALAELGALVAARRERELRGWLGDLDRLARRAGGEFPFLALTTELIAAEGCRKEGSPWARAEAGRRLGALPEWLRQPAADALAAQASYEAAQLDLTAGVRLDRAWRRLREAEERFSRSAHPLRISVALAKADILARTGATGEALERLRAQLLLCQVSPCQEAVLPSVYSQLGWLVLLDPDSDPQGLDEARQYLERSLAQPNQPVDLEERGNLGLNLAYLDLLQGRDPLPRVWEARRDLAGGDPVDRGSGRRRFLTGWADLLTGLAALERGDWHGARESCDPLGTDPEPQLAAWALSCSGEARRRQGDLRRAQWLFERALGRHASTGPEQLGQALPLGPGRRADDYYRAARAAIELGDPLRAWETLDRLDELTAGEEAARRCLEEASGGQRSPALAARRRQAVLRRQAVQSELAALDLPAAEERRRQIEPLRRALLEEVQELSRQLTPCAEPAARRAPGSADLRAFPLPDEIVLLRREASGRVSLARRTPLARRDVVRRIRVLTAALDRRDLGDAAWRERLGPLARALAPPGGEGETVSYALYGVLQGVPLTGAPREEGWLADRTTVVIHPAASGDAVPLPQAELVGRPLFVVDPLGDLAGGSALLTFFPRRFPGAKVLAHGAATRGALLGRLGRIDQVSLLHLDVHGRYDAAFPELSSLQLADGALAWSQLAGGPVPRGLVNLSGCKTGVWPATADSGRYGLAGLFARRGAAWVVASRGDLDDRVAQDFNRRFYALLSAGRGVPESYAGALAALRERYPVTRWAGLLLLRGAAGEKRET